MSLKEEILSKMPNDLNDLEKARYLYIELGKRLSFSTSFTNNPSLTLKMLHANVDINTFKSNQVNCIMWSQLYSQLLNCVGIKNNIVKQGHEFVEFYIDDIRWCADATYGEYTDLAKIHNNDETYYFGIAANPNSGKHNGIYFNEEINDLIKSIDDKIGYNYNSLTELREFLNKIRTGNFNIKDYIPTNETIDSEFIYCIEYLFSKINTLKSGYYESKYFVKNLIFTMFNDEQLKKVKGVELKRTNRMKEVDIVQCIYAYDNDKLHYYLLAPNLPIKKIEKEEIIKLAALGYGIDNNKTIPGIDFPKNFVRGKVSTNLKYLLQKNSLPKELLVYDTYQYQSNHTSRH